jgi:hypothetical protein
MLCGWKGLLAQERTKLIQWAKDQLFDEHSVIDLKPYHNVRLLSWVLRYCLLHFITFHTEALMYCTPSAMGTQIPSATIQYIPH